VIASLAILGTLTPSGSAGEKLTKERMEKIAAALTKAPRKGVIHSHVKGTPTTAGGKRTSTGKVMVSHPSRGSGQAEIHYTIEEALAKGPNDHSMLVENKTTKQSAKFGFNDATGLATMTVGKHTVKLKHNPDKSWTVDGANYKSRRMAAVAALRDEDISKGVGPRLLYGAYEALKGQKPATKGFIADAAASVASVAVREIIPDVAEGAAIKTAEHGVSAGIEVGVDKLKEGGKGSTTTTTTVKKITPVAGAITKVSATSISVRVNPTTINTYALNKSVKVTIKSKAAKISDLKVGDQVTIAQNLGGDLVITKK
jgi:hypothetical protein